MGLLFSALCVLCMIDDLGEFTIGAVFKVLLSTFFSLLAIDACNEVALIIGQRLLIVAILPSANVTIP